MNVRLKTNGSMSFIERVKREEYFDIWRRNIGINVHCRRLNYIMEEGSYRLAFRKWKHDVFPPKPKKSLRALAIVSDTIQQKYVKKSKNMGCKVF